MLLKKSLFLQFQDINVKYNKSKCFSLENAKPDSTALNVDPSVID